MVEQLKIISLFSGAGGLDSGFSQAGFETIIALDNEQSAVDTFNSNHPGNVAQCVDLNRYPTKKFIELVQSKACAKIPAGVIGGPPCQGV